MRVGGGGGWKGGGGMIGCIFYSSGSIKLHIL